MAEESTLRHPVVSGLFYPDGAQELEQTVDGYMARADRASLYKIIREQTGIPDPETLVPIALVYAVAHYFSLFVIQGQFVAPLLSDPLGRGWDIFGTAGVQPNLGVLGPNTIWYVQAASLVLGHVAGLAVAHDRAVAIFRDRGDALRSQYAMLALMVVYTVGGLWLLSRG